jgi:hypothetical protein
MCHFSIEYIIMRKILDNVSRTPLVLLKRDESEALKLSLGDREDLTNESSSEPCQIRQRPSSRRANMIYYDSEARAVCLAWLWGNDESFIADYTQAEIRRVIHEQVGLRSSRAYDNLAQLVEAEVSEVPLFLRKSNSR